MTQQRFNEDLCEFLRRSPTPFHAVATMSAELKSNGFELLQNMDQPLEPGGKYLVERNGSSLVAFIVGTDLGASEGVRMVGAHTDSPCLMVKPQPERSKQGYFQLGVQVYGGALLNPWFDRDLSLAGRVSFEAPDGTLHSALVDFRSPVAIIPSLAIHLDRQANSSRSINSQTDIVPVLAQVADGETPDFRTLLGERILAEHPHHEVKQVLDFEMSFYDSQPASLVGLNEEFLASARLDNLLSCFTGMRALLQADAACTTLLVCNDHEEVGSLSAAGAQGPLLTLILKRLAGDDASYASLVDRSLMMSADNAHGVHPNFADRHDENHGPRLNAGPVIKINANQRYATNSETAGLYRLLAEREGVPVQSFVVRTDMACGSTIGPITAGETGVSTLDIGVPTFAMHSIRELAGTADAWNLCKVLSRFYNYRGSLTAD
ncbi:MAG: M18 family aminopeptidase [Halioglobus sp.]